MNYLQPNMGDFIVICIIAALLYFCARSLIKAKKSGISSCGCGKNCATCAMACMHGHIKKS